MSDQIREYEISLPKDHVRSAMVVLNIRLLKGQDPVKVHVSAKQAGQLERHGLKVKELGTKDAKRTALPPSLQPKEEKDEKQQKANVEAAKAKSAAKKDKPAGDAPAGGND